MTMPMSRTTADRIFDVLAQWCGAEEWRRDDFVHYATNTWAMEYRFQGHLGFGGKLYVDWSGCRVSCYPEDVTAATATLVPRVNEMLREVVRGELEAK